MKAPNHCAPISARRKGRNTSRSVTIRQLLRGLQIYNDVCFLHCHRVFSVLVGVLGARGTAEASRAQANYQYRRWRIGSAQKARLGKDWQKYVVEVLSAVLGSLYQAAHVRSCSCRRKKSQLWAEACVISGAYHCTATPCSRGSPIGNPTPCSRFTVSRSAEVTQASSFLYCYSMKCRVRP